MAEGAEGGGRGPGAGGRAPRVLVTGATGYLGQFVAARCARAGAEVARAARRAGGAGRGPGEFRVDVASGEGLAELGRAFGRPDVVVNLAALSQPRACEADPAAAAAVNVPSALLDWLGDSLRDVLFVHASTDQVYPGERACSLEGDAARPVNAYGRTKAAAEGEIRRRAPRHVILRSSIIFGPEPPVPVGRPLFVQWIAGELRAGRRADFFEDEFRSPIYVRDWEEVVARLLDLWRGGGEVPCGTFNLGGPERLSRVDMAAAVARVLGADPALVRACPAPPAAERGVASPADISMLSTALEDALGLRFTPFEAALEETFTGKV